MMNAAYSFLFIALPLASVVSKTAAQSTSGCQLGWVGFEASCYAFLRQKETWTGAASFCTSLGGYLVTINSKAENDFVVSKLMNKPFMETWIGANDLLEEGKFRWVSNNEPVVFSDWYRGKANPVSEIENCVEIYAAWGYIWNNVQCVEQKEFVCEKAK
ncbi:hypothetical protein BsWGS_24846 [Bradybaena similaris]